jgi:hypothetical protein
VSLVARQKYYIEALQKEGVGGDNLSVGWRTPTMAATATPVVIPGSVLSPFILSTARLASTPERKVGLTLTADPNPFADRLRISFTALGAAPTRLVMYDVRGVPIRALFEGTLQEGETKLLEVGTMGLTGGVYFLRLVSGSLVIHLKLVTAG